jgi:putative SOS response-associated peptidase YedK
MCQRYMLATPIEELSSRYNFVGGVPYPPRPNIRPGEPVCVVRFRPGVEASGERELALVRWGLIPHWVKDPREFGALMNARAETILEKPSFKTPMRHRRCIVPADGWYTWTGRPGHKIAHLLRPAGDTNRLMGFAALWDHWLGTDGSEIDTMAIITVAASPEVETVDDRMPVLLNAKDAGRWIDVRGVGQDEASKMLKPWRGAPLEIAQVTRLDDPTRDTPETL